MLSDCGRILEKRSKSYLSYKEERKRVAEMVGGMFGVDIDPDLVTAVMLFTKLVRHKRRSKPKKDDFVDAINYLALAWESQ